MTTPVHQRVDPRPNKASPLGLFAASRFVVDGSDQITPAVGDPNQLPTRWIGGLSYKPEKCDGGSLIDVAASLPTADAQETEIDVMPFLVLGSDKLSVMGQGDDALRAERVGFAQRDYLACEQSMVMKELWEGTQAVANSWPNRYLADASVDLVEGDRLVGYLTAFAVLERAIADGTCSQQGVIHARADTVAYWVSEHLCRREGNLIVSEEGTLIVTGSGYNGKSPKAGTAHLDPAHAGLTPSADSAWAYATTVIDLYRSDWVNTQPMIERVDPSSTTAATTNLMTTFARKYVAATWPCFQVGVHVDHLNRTTTTGS